MDIKISDVSLEQAVERAVTAEVRDKLSRVYAGHIEQKVQKALAGAADELAIELHAAINAALRSSAFRQQVEEMAVLRCADLIRGAMNGVLRSIGQRMAMDKALQDRIAAAATEKVTTP